MADEFQFLIQNLHHAARFLVQNGASAAQVIAVQACITMLSDDSDDEHPEADPAHIKGGVVRQGLQAQMGPWQAAIDDALIAHCLDCTGPDSDPRECLSRLLRVSEEMALDPAISERAQALIDRGRALQWCDREGGCFCKFQNQVCSNYVGKENRK